MSPGRQEQKTPTEDELNDFERRKNAPPAAPPSFPQFNASGTRSRGSWVALSGFVIVALMLGGVVSLMQRSSSYPMSASPSVAVDGPLSTTAPSASPMASTTTPHIPTASMSQALIAEILRRPTRYIGTDVYVEASLRRAISPNAFIVSDGVNDLLVIDVSNERSGASGPELRIYGEVRDVKDAPSEFRRDYKGRVFIRAYMVREN